MAEELDYVPMPDNARRPESRTDLEAAASRTAAARPSTERASELAFLSGRMGRSAGRPIRNESNGPPMTQIDHEGHLQYWAACRARPAAAPAATSSVSPGHPLLRSARAGAARRRHPAR